MESWCNKLASTPAVGLRLDPHFTSSDALIDALSPLLDELSEGEVQRFNVEEQNSFSFQFNTEEGYRFGADESRIHVTFNHRLKVEAISGGPPTMKMLSKPMPYTELLSNVTDKTVRAALLLPNAKNRMVRRSGIVSTTSVDPNEAPPGIKRFIEYMSRPWSGSVDHFTFAIAGEIQDRDEYRDRCVHTITRPEDPEKLTTLQFDYQRFYKNGHPVVESVLYDLLRELEKSSLSYLEDLAEGSKFDEAIIGTAN